MSTPNSDQEKSISLWCGIAELEGAASRFEPGIAAESCSLEAAAIGISAMDYRSFGGLFSMGPDSKSRAV